MNRLLHALSVALLGLAALLAAGCSASTPTAVDAPAPTVPCGGDTCESDEFCVFPCSGIDAGVPLPPPQCRPLTDATCSADDPCGCFCMTLSGPGDTCRILYDPADREVHCSCA